MHENGQVYAELARLLVGMENSLLVMSHFLSWDDCLLPVL